MWMVLGIVGGVAAASGLALQAGKDAIGFRSPRDVLEQRIPPGKRFQLGGMVVKGSVQRTPGSLEVRFIVRDYDGTQLPVRYEKVLPDLFKEEAGVGANGKRDEHGVFVADEVLAKHDEKYMPPALGKAMQKGDSRFEAEPTPKQP